MSHFKLFLHQSVRRAALLGLALAASVLSAHAQVLFTPPLKLSNDPWEAGQQQIAVDLSGNINVVWAAANSVPGDVWFARSTDGGVTFSAPIDVSNNPGGSFAPSLVLNSSGDIYVAWTGSSNFAITGPSAIFFARSNDGGQTFSTAVNVSGAQPAAGAYLGSLALDSGSNPYFAWSGCGACTTPSPIFFSRSNDGGTTFSPPVQVSNDQAQLPQVAVDSSGNIDVVWNEASSSSPYKPVFFSHSTDGGGTFSTPITVSGNTYFQPEQQMMVDSSGNIYVLESLDPTPNGVDGDIWLARSSDGGATFSLINVSNNPGSNNPNQGRMALDAAGNVSIVWVQLVSSQWQMFYRRSTDGGATFSAPVNVTNGLAGDPQIAVDPTGNVNVVWDQYTGLSQSIDIYFSRSSDGGSTFSSPQNISNNLDPNLNPSIVSSRVPMIAVDSGANVYVVWQDHTGPASVSTPVGNIFFSRGISPFAVTPTPGI